MNSAFLVFDLVARKAGLSASAISNVSSIQNLMTLKKRAGLSSEKTVNWVPAGNALRNSTGRIRVILRSNDGEKVSASKRLSVVNPATGKRLAAIPDVDRALLDKAINAARNAFAGWGVVPFEHRQTIVASLLDKIDSHADELCALLTAEQGAPLRKYGRKSLFLPKHSDRPSCKWRHLRKNKMGNP